MKINLKKSLFEKEAILNSISIFYRQGGGDVEINDNSEYYILNFQKDKLDKESIRKVVYEQQELIETQNRFRSIRELIVKKAFFPFDFK